MFVCKIFLTLFLIKPISKLRSFNIRLCFQIPPGISSSSLSPFISYFDLPFFSQIKRKKEKYQTQHKYIKESGNGRTKVKEGEPVTVVGHSITNATFATTVAREEAFGAIVGKVATDDLGYYSQPSDPCLPPLV